MYLYFTKSKFDNSQPQLQIACCYSKTKITAGLLFHYFILTTKKRKKTFYLRRLMERPHCKSYGDKPQHKHSKPAASGYSHALEVQMLGWHKGFFLMSLKCLSFLRAASPLLLCNCEYTIKNITLEMIFILSFNK